ncbi:MAG TPA: polysaccharide biosynthesis tyrosine autokinase [Rhizomicrobium sp.]|jgi:uncharacterized protein involved in exopolysaccharide biosynthesis|nr:polysaccharide biosynthesis tyrosine autokinase [Rhizomicrobium sp.]
MANGDPVANEQAFRLHDLARLARERSALILTVMAVVIVLAVIAVFLIPQRYAASSVVVIDPRKNNVADVTAVVSDLPVDPASVQDQIQILESRDLAGRVIDKLGLASDPEFNPPPGALSAYFGAPDDAPQALRDAEITTFLKHLTVEGLGLSTAITITYSSRDAHQAARIANAVADLYISGEVDAKLNDTRATTDWLATRIKQLSHQVQAAEANVQAYKAEHDLNETADGSSLVDQQLTAINGQLVDAKSDLAEKQANMGRIDAMMKSGHAADVSSVVSSPLIAQLREQQAEVIRSESEMATKYGPKNPKLIAAQNQERDLAAKIDEEVSRVAGTVANDVSVAHAHVGSLQGSLRQAETEATDQNMARVRLKALEANASSTRTMYEAFVVRLRETQSPIGIPDARVISHASAPASPSFPPRFAIIAASVPAGFLLGLLLALLAERMGYAWAPRRNPVMDRLRNIPVLAQLAGGAVARAADQAVDFPGAPFAQGIALLARQMCDPRGPKVVAIAASQPGEDSSQIAAAVARVAALMGRRVVIVDGNLRTPMAARSLGANLPQAGLMEVLGHKASLSQALMRDARSQAFVLSPAWPPRDPMPVLASRQMAELLTHLRRSCDLVLIDAPPVLTAAETRVLVHLSDAVALVVRNASPESVLGAVDMLAASGSPPVGLVLAH